MSSIQKVNEKHPRSLSDSDLKKIGAELSKPELLILKNLLHDSSFGIWGVTLLENSVLEQDPKLQGMEVRNAIKSLEDKKLLRVLTDAKGANPFASLQANTYYLHLIGGLKKRWAELEKEVRN